MSKHLNSKGFSFIEALLIILIVALLGFGGYWVYARRHHNKPQVTTTTSKTSTTNGSSNSQTPVINSSKDVDSAITSLDNTNLDSGNSQDLSQISSDASTF